VQLKALETSLQKAKEHLSEKESKELLRSIAYVVNEYGAMDEKLDTTIRKAL
jgi:hypothetical protein